MKTLRKLIPDLSIDPQHFLPTMWLPNPTYIYLLQHIEDCKSIFYATKIYRSTPLSLNQEELVTQVYACSFLPTYEIHHCIKDLIAQSYVSTILTSTLEISIPSFILLKPYSLFQNCELKFAAWWVRPLMALMALMGGEFNCCRVKLFRQCLAWKKNEQEEKCDTHCEYYCKVPPFGH